MRLAALVLVTGCSFSGPSMSPATGGGDDVAPPDAPATATPDSPASPPLDAPPVTSAVACATTNSFGLIGCYEFEDDLTKGVLHDSSPSMLDATTTGLMATTHASSQAARVMTSNATRVPQDARLDRADAFSVLMWVNPTTLPTSGKVMGLVDHEDQYAMAIGRDDDDVTLRCILTGGAYYEWADGVPQNKWSLAACTWDGIHLCAYRWTASGDHAMNCFEPDDGIATKGAAGLAIGSLSSSSTPSFRFDGALDSLHLYNRALSEGELCSEVGQASTHCLE